MSENDYLNYLRMFGFESGAQCADLAEAVNFILSCTFLLALLCKNILRDCCKTIFYTACCKNLHKDDNSTSLFFSFTLLTDFDLFNGSFEAIFEFFRRFWTEKIKKSFFSHANKCPSSKFCFLC